MILLVDNGSLKTPKIKEIIEKYTSVKTIFYKELNTIKFTLFKGVILSGAPILLSKEENKIHINYFTVLKKIKIPILGICFGHQILSLLFGGEVYIQNEDRNLNEIQKLTSSPLLEGFGEKFFMQEDHCEWTSLPNDFILLANSGNCTNEAMQHKFLPFYGVQFHPEVSGELGEKLIDNFIKQC
ncbi:MAG: gamma-glutamyl-gamma-aminobutyrate hydrolase family protein [Flavobacteriia bacterium]|nr:gamma-glutamyl-gamma-aminobutyrate hydrolase family protein [Flavobacteriia bacterium]